MSRRHVLQLYKSLIQESKKFPSYNFRQYALRRIRDSFKENRNLTTEEAIRNKLEEGANNLEILKRQVIIGQLYSTDKLVIEHVMSQAK